MTEVLRNARHNARFTAIGKVKLFDDSLKGGVINARGNWEGVNDRICIDIGDGRMLYPQIQGGRDIERGVIYRQGKRDEEGKTENLKIPIDERNDESWLEKVAPSGFRYVTLKGDERKSFVDDVDYVEYLQEHLVSGTDVVVTGNVEYSRGRDGSTWRNYQITNIYLNTTDEDGKLKREPNAFLEQTYLLDEFSLSRNFSKELAKEGRTVITAKVAQYLSSIPNPNGKGFIDYKRVAPLTQTLVVKADKDNPESLAKAKKVIETVFAIKRGKVREIILDMLINEGYEKSQGDVVVSPELQELIDMGLMTKEDLVKGSTVRGRRVNELLFNGIQPLVLKDRAIRWDDDRFTPEALIFASVDSDDASSSVGEAFESEETEDVTEEISSLDEGLNATFSDLFAD